MTFDVYLAILRAIQCRINQALGRDDPNWRLQHYCPACTFKVRFQPPYYTIPSNNFISNLVNLSLFPQVSRLWMATILPSEWIMQVMLTAAYSPVHT